MSLTNEDLLAISNLMDTKIGTLDKKIDDVKNELKSDITSIKDNVQDLKTDVQNLKTDVQDLKGDVQNLKGEQSRINLIIENEIRNDIKILAENYVPAAKRYEKDSAKIEKMQSDVDMLKKVVAEHSEKLQRIS